MAQWQDKSEATPLRPNNRNQRNLSNSNPDPYAQSVAASSHKMASLIPSGDFYSQYHGHNEGYLQQIVDHFRSRDNSIIWFAGDSTLDNKYWFYDTHSACNGYQEVLDPAMMKADVCYWTNKELERNPAAKSSQLVCVNTSIEATTLSNRGCCTLMAQDKVIQENIGKNDYLVVSIGGNDIALKVK